MSNTKVIGWTPQLDNALKKLIRNGTQPPNHVSKKPVFRQQTKLAAGNAVVQGTISCYNNSDEAIAVYTAVCITGDYFSEDSPDGKESRLNGNCFIKGKAAKDDSLPWGIATCDIAPGGVGDIIIQGIAPALWTGNGVFVSPSSTGLIGSLSGRGEVISPAYKELPGIILLGGGSGAAVDEYNGTFKLLPVSATQLKLISGSVPEQTDFAGGSDVPGFSEIPQMTMELAPDIRHRIYIYFDYDKAGKEYSVHLGTEIPDGIVLYEYLGEFFNGRVVQSYKNNSYLRFGDIWYLTPEGE